MTIKSHSPWQLKAAFGMALIGFSAVVAFWAYDAGRRFTGDRAHATAQDVVDLNDKVVALRLERDRFLSLANAAESQQNIAQATQTQLNKQITALEVDNAKLKEDLAFFEGLLPTAIGNEGVTIQRLNLALVAPTQLRYRSLIMRGGNNGRDFVGDFQILVTAVVRGKNVVLTYPEQNANPTDKAGFRLDFKYYQRIDGVVTLPEGTTIKALQVKVLEKGQVRAQQSTHL